MKKRMTTLSVAVSLALLTGCELTDDDNNGPAVRSVDTIVDFTATAAQAVDFSGLSYAADGRIYASGYTDADPDDRQTVVARFDANGNPDQTFGDNGFVTLDISDTEADVSSGNEGSLAVVELADGDVIVAVNAADRQVVGGDLDTEGSNAYLVRLDSTGARDTGFGTDGVVEVEFGRPADDDGDFATDNGFFPEASIGDLQVDNSGDAQRIVVFGVGTAEEGSGRTDQDRYITRVLATNGTVDDDFNGGAYYTYDSGNELGDNSRRGLVEADGTITSAGYTNFGGDLGNHIILIRLLADGTPDQDFGDFIQPTGNITGADGPGIAVFNPFLEDGGFAEAYAVLRQSGGGFVTAGYGAADGNGTSEVYQTTTAPDVVTHRVFTGEAVIDVDYGNLDAPGTQAIQSEGEGRESEEERGRDAVILEDDTAVFVGYFAGTPAAYFFTPDGQLDTRVDDDGILEMANPANTSQFYATAIDGNRIAMTTRNDTDSADGARLVILEID